MTASQLFPSFRAKSRALLWRGWLSGLLARWADGLRSRLLLLEALRGGLECIHLRRPYLPHGRSYLQCPANARAEEGARRPSALWGSGVPRRQQGLPSRAGGSVVLGNAAGTRGDLERGQSCSASPSSSCKCSQRGKLFFFSIIIIFRWRCCLKSHCWGWWPGCLPLSCRVGGCCGGVLTPAPDPAEPKLLPAGPSTPPPGGFTLGCPLPYSHLAAMLCSPLLPPAAHHGAKSPGAAREGRRRNWCWGAGGAGGCPGWPCPSPPAASHPPFPPRRLRCPPRRGCKAGTRGKTDRQTDRQMADGHSPLRPE